MINPRLCVTTIPLALLLVSCSVGDPSRAGLHGDGHDLLVDPPPSGLQVPPLRPFDSGVSPLPGAASVAQFPAASQAFFERSAADSRILCQGEANDRCLPGERCCPTTGFCVPESCPGCCPADDYWRSEPVEAPDPETLPDIDPVGPTGDDEDDDRPAEPAPRGGNTPGPMPPPPNN